MGVADCVRGGRSGRTVFLTSDNTTPFRATSLNRRERRRVNIIIHAVYYREKQQTMMA